MNRLPDYQPGLGGIEGFGSLPDHTDAASVCEALETLAFDEGMTHPVQTEACFKREIALQPQGIISRVGTELLLDSAFIDAHDPDKGIASPWCKLSVLARYNEQTDVRYTSLTLMIGGFSMLADQDSQRRLYAMGEGYYYETEVQPNRSLYLPGHVLRAHSTAVVAEGRQEHVESLLRSELQSSNLQDLQRDYATRTQSQAIEALAEAIIST
jgi:hypothetical protein